MCIYIYIYEMKVTVNHIYVVPMYVAIACQTVKPTELKLCMHIQLITESEHVRMMIGAEIIKGINAHSRKFPFCKRIYRVVNTN